MKQFSTILITLIVFSCKEPLKSVPNQGEDSSLDSIVNIISETYPLYKENSLIRAKASHYLKFKIDSLLNNGVLSDTYLKVLSIDDIGKQNKSLIHLYTEFTNTTSKTPALFELLCYCDDSIASKLSDKKMYKVEGENFKRLEGDEILSIVNFAWIGPDCKIEKNKLDSSIYDFQLGEFICDAKTFIP